MTVVPLLQASDKALQTAARTAGADEFGLLDFVEAEVLPDYGRIRLIEFLTYTQVTEIGEPELEVADGKEE